MATAAPTPGRPMSPPPMNRPAAPRMGPPPSTDAVIPAGAQVPRFAVAQPKPIVPRVFLYAPEKFGKTSLPAFAPNPIVFQIKDTGYQTLLDAGSVPPCPAPVIENYHDLNAVVDAFLHDPQDRKTAIFDGYTGIEKCIHDWVCDTHYGGDWGDHGFLSYNKGYDLAIPEVVKFLSKLNRIRDKGIEVWVLAHATTKPQKNPIGPDYDKFVPQVHEKTWGPATKWADAILFGKFHTIVDVAKREKSKSTAEQKGKAIGGIDRVIFTRPCDAWVAGTRYAMESEIWLTDVEAKDMYSIVRGQMRRQGAPA